MNSQLWSSPCELGKEKTYHCEPLKRTVADASIYILERATFFTKYHHSTVKRLLKVLC